MSQFNEGKKTFTAGGAIPRFARVGLNAGNVVVVNEDEACIGFAETAVQSGELVAVKLINNAGTFKAIAKEAIVSGASLFGSDGGKVQSTDPGGGTVRFVALEAASSDEAIVEVMPLILN